MIEQHATGDEVAKRAAADAVATLNQAINERGAASWGLAGGTSPLAAYKELARRYADALDWSKVTVFVGDERCVPLDQPDSNWGQISKLLFADAMIARVQMLIPSTEHGASAGALAYDTRLGETLVDKTGRLSLDLLWLGVGADGHTLSLFPGRDTIDNDDALMIPVYDSPKPPAQRITLSLTAASHARKLVVFAVGAAKKAALATVRQDPQSLPIGLVVETAKQAGATILWLYDDAAMR